MENDDDIIEFGRPKLGDEFDWGIISKLSAPPALDEPKVNMTDEAVQLTRIARETDAARHRKVPSTIAMAIARGRMTVGLTQKQLATRLSIDSKHIAAIEAGTAVYVASELQRIRRFLGLPKFST